MIQLYSEGRVVSLLSSQVRAQAHFPVFQDTGGYGGNPTRRETVPFHHSTATPWRSVCLTYNRKYILGVSSLKSTSCNTTISWQSPTETYTHSSIGTRGLQIWVISSVRKGMASHCGHPDSTSSEVQEYAFLAITCPESYICKRDFKTFVDFLEFMAGNSIAGARKGHQRHRWNIHKPCVKQFV